MSDMNSWMALRSAMQDDGRPARRCAPRPGGGSPSSPRPHRRTITLFLLLATGGAILGVATPLLAGQAVDAIVEGGSHQARWWRWRCDRARGAARHGDRAARTPDLVPARRGPDPRPAPAGLRARAGHADRVLHPHPHRRAGQPAEQRRDRRPARLHLGAGRCRHERDRARAHARGDAAAVLVDHPAVGPPPAALRHPGPAGRRTGRRARAGGGRPQRRHDLPDDGALLGARAPPS